MIHPDSDSSCTFSLLFKIVASSLLCLTLVLSAVENMIVCIAVLRRRELRTAPNIYIVSLAISDIIISLSVPILEMVYVISYPHWPLGTIGTYFQNSFWLFSIAMPFVTVTVITVDRYRAVTSFTRYFEQASVTSAVVTVLGIWVYTAAMVALMAFNFESAPPDRYTWNVKEEWYYPFLALHVVVPFFIIFVLYYYIIRAARTSHTQVSSTTDTNISVRTELRLAKTIAIIIGLLFLVWFPVFCMEIVYAFDSESCIVKQIGDVSVLITCINGVINPWVYWRRSIDFRKAFINLFGFCRCCFYRKRRVFIDDIYTPSI